MEKQSIAFIMIFLLLFACFPKSYLDKKVVEEADKSNKMITSENSDMHIPPTLVKMMEYDYVSNSVTGLSDDLLPLKELQQRVKKHGTLYGKGMPYSEYKKVMSYVWEDCTDYENKPESILIDIENTMNYWRYEETIKKLSRYEGVYLYKLGVSTQGRTIYAIEVDVPSELDKEVLMFTGQIHAREFAGGTYLIKMFTDLVQKAQTDTVTMDILKKYRFVTVPIINVDGREALIAYPMNWIVSGAMWKAYINGTDGNRNFPGLLWGQLSKGNKLRWNITFYPGHENYAGEYAGSCKETKALMKWVYHYTVVDKARLLIDMHQQGSVIYAGKTWSTKSQEGLSENIRKKIMKLLNSGATKRKYEIMEDEKTYGFDGSYSTITDYAVSVSCGAKFSPAMGFCAFTDGTKEYMLMETGDMDGISFKVKAPNKNFTTLTIEIGKGSEYLGNSKLTRKLLAEEYFKYHYNILLEELPGMLH